jgi:hypothetical protein
MFWAKQSQWGVSSPGALSPKPAPLLSPGKRCRGFFFGTVQAASVGGLFQSSKASSIVCPFLGNPRFISTLTDAFAKRGDDFKSRLVPFGAKGASTRYCSDRQINPRLAWIFVLFRSSRKIGARCRPPPPFDAQRWQFRSCVGDRRG